ncbi:MAG: hypothetical protein MJZ33_05090 [Paludibacteraceae bacterium]|nr:hypothetical protein [Paludibacteraceae bacterium]
MNRIKYYLLLFFAAFSLGVTAQTDFFGIPKVEIGGEEYSLAWSAKIKFRYVEDFLPKKASNSRFSSKVSLDFFNADVELSKVVASKMAELEVNKAENLLTNLSKMEAPNGDVYIEYVGYVPDGEKMRVAEYNICRYSANSTGVILLQMKHREYDIKLEKFLSVVEKNGAKWKADVKAYNIPDITVK